MEIIPDFKELFASLNANRVEFLIVGGYALAHHGKPRFTGDLDIYLKPDPENAVRVIKALDDFGFGSADLKPDDFTAANRVIQLGYSPVRIDLLNSISGVSWAEAFAGRVKGDYGGVEVYYIGREQLIANKRATGRKQDLADLEALGEE